MANITAALNPTLDLFPILSRFPPQPCGAPLTGIARLAAESSPAGEGHRMELRSLAVRSVLNRSVSRRGWGGPPAVPTRGLGRGGWRCLWITPPSGGCVPPCRYCYARYTHEFMQ